MLLPFSVEQFLDVFRRYNEAIGPAPVALNLLAVVVMLAALNGGRVASRVATGVLAMLWFWMGAVYHILFFRAINPIAMVFGIAFIAEGLLIAWLGLVGGRLAFGRQRGATVNTALILFAYALVAYPTVGYVLGHRYPSAPTFGVPCPTTIFTLGMLLLATTPRPRALLVIPAAWAVLGLSAAIQLGMWEDLGLTAAAIVASMMVLVQERRSPRSESPRPSRSAVVFR